MKNKTGKVVGISISNRKRVAKKPVETARLIENFGLENDVHASSTSHRQVSLLDVRSIERMKQAGFPVNIGSFGENIAVEGIDLSSVRIGDKFKLGENIIIEITQIGKECHTRCAIFYKAGDCIMPNEGIFAKVLAGGILNVGDPIERIYESINIFEVKIMEK